MIQTQVNKEKMTLIESIIFVVMFVLPFPIMTLSPAEYNYPLMIAFLLGYFFMFMFLPRYFLTIFRSKAFFIILLYTIGALLKFLAYGYWLTVPSIVLPIVAFFGYYYIDNKQIDLRVFDVLLISLYVFFILTYYRYLPSYFFREAFDDGSWYGGSSSNAIAIILVNVLYIYIVITYLQQEDRGIKLLLFSIINLFLIIVQQSRAGVLLSLFFVIWQLLRIGRVKNSRQIRFISWLIIFAGIIWVLNNGQLITQYTDVVGDMSSSAYETDGRNSSLQSFFQNMDSFSFFLGYPFVTDFGGNGYTFNIFADHWNRYTFLGFVVLVTILFHRILHHKEYYFPLIFIIPFLLYSWVEPRYLPNFWDFFIYLMLFKKCEFQELTETS